MKLRLLIGMIIKIKKIKKIKVKDQLVQFNIVESISKFGALRMSIEQIQPKKKEQETV